MKRRLNLENPGYHGNMRERTLGRPRYRWEDNIETDLQEIRWDGVKLIYMAGGRTSGVLF
jgi:hypothetical protein